MFISRLLGGLTAGSTITITPKTHRVIKVSTGKLETILVTEDLLIGVGTCWMVC
ncbi:hypothetical protein L2D08_05795 [Domibacillus sp. PGB-M46]|uniref:hypothetical protein n=1 Tax=Domibacillus sp. PGB-M46 TaxID=2910255 RepID=UPI001F589964|nr:hypothetical protein [Domibacillus sp. PGB-M46]MCI2253874.1 hypothetical protein [Domibacillus sp. PGB-M46]